MLVQIFQYSAWITNVSIIPIITNTCNRNDWLLLEIIIQKQRDRIDSRGERPIFIDELARRLNVWD